VVPILARHNISFKFALDLEILRLMNSKGWSRQAAGKFITVYPLDEEQFRFLIEKLYQATRRFEGLYILSDRRYKDSRVIFYRYGGIRPHAYPNSKGEQVSVLVSPEGEREPDIRRPYFYVPSWAKDPFEDDQASSSTAIADSDGILLKEGRYLVKTVLGFSNSGGVYVAEDTQTGQEVVIKEARPFVTATEDATSLLKKEHRILSKIAHTKVAPQPLDFFQDWEHFFLVQEYITGAPLSGFAARNNVTLHTHPTLEQAQKFFADFKTLFLQIAEILRLMHQHNIVLADLSPNNIIVLPDTLEVKFIDFEGAYEIGHDNPIYLYTPGFAYADQMGGAAATFESDYFSFGAIMHYFLAPINQIFLIHPRARFTFMESVIKDIGFPAKIGEMITALIDKEAKKRPAPLEVISILETEEEVVAPHFHADDSSADPMYQGYIDAICDYILAVATYDRRDRLFPADPQVFNSNPLSIAHGACGVACALKKMGRQVPHQVIDWIAARNKNAELYPPGLYVGLSGIAWAMLELGLKEEAQKVLHSTYDHPLLFDSPNLYYGVAGWGMANLKFFLETEDELYLQKAEEAGKHLMETLSQEEKGYCWKTDDGIPLGYAYGASGISLFLLYLHLAAGSETYIEAGIRAMDFDINNADPNIEDGLSWKRFAEQGSILYPYWRYGSAGVGLSALRYYRLLGGEKYKNLLDKIYLDTNRKYTVFPGLFNGLSGLGEFLLDMHQLTQESRFLEGAYRAATGISLFKIEKPEGIAFPGDMLRRISCDYGTGSAGVGHFLHRLVNKTGGSFHLDALFTRMDENAPTGKHFVAA
jgi:serine/threonine protein kinase